ncbi:MAG: efflux RND transporter permease subunit [Acetobacteraceae bacterium]
MMRWIISSSLRLRTLIAAFAVLLLVIGGWQLRTVPLDVVPEFSPLSLQVKTEALGLSAAEVESLITVPMEADLLNGVPWLKSIESESVTGLSSIEMFFVPGTNLMQARQMVQERLTQAHALPNVSKPPLLLQPISSASRIMNIGLSSQTVPLIDMSVQAQWNIMPKLVGVPGVANVSIWGQRERQLQVLVDPKRLHDKHASLEQIVKTTGEAVWASPLTYLNSSTPGSGGFIDMPNQRLAIRHVSPISSAKEFARIPVHGTSLALGDVAEVVESHQPLIGDAVLQTGPGLMLVVEKFPNYNTQDVTRGLLAAIDALRPGLTGIDIDTTIYRPAGFIERATGNLSLTLLISAILAVLAIWIMLGNWRTALIGTLAIPLSLIAAGLVFYARGVNLNMMIVAGLLVAITIVVDDAVTSVTNIAQRLRDPRLGSPGNSTWDTIVRASLEVRGPMLYATLIAAIIVAPVLFMQGLAAAFFEPLVWSYILAIVASMLVALIVTPALSMLLLPNQAAAPAGRSTPAGAVQSAYDRIAPRTTTSMLPALVMVAAGIAAVFLVWSQRDRDLIPSFKETDVLVEWQAAAGTSLQAMNRTTAGLIKELSAIPGVRNAAAHIGRAVLSHDVSDVNAGEVWVSIDPRADYAETLAAIEQVAATYPGVNGQVETFLSKKMREHLTGEDENLTVRLYGHDLTILRAKAEEVKTMLSRINGVSKPRVEQQAERPTIQVRVDLDRARDYGLKPGDVRRAASALISGITVGALFQDQKVFDVVVWGAPDTRNSLHDIQNLLIDTDTGAQVRLADVADVRLAPATSIIRREGASRRLDVEASVSGRSMAAVSEDVTRQLRNIVFPFEYHAQVIGAQVERRTAVTSLYSYLVAAGVLVFLLFQAAFRSWRLAVVAIIGLPAALLGGMVVMYLVETVSLLGTLLGLMAVLGLAVRNQIMLVRRFQELEQAGQQRERAVTRGMNESVQSVVTTAITLAVIALPFIFFGDVAGLEILHPTAVVMLGGLVTSTLYSLVGIPAMYLRSAISLPVDDLAMTPEKAS